MPFIQGALFATMNTGTDLARDIETGFLNRLSLTPMRSVALLLGQLGGTVTLGLFQAVVYIVVGLAAGVRFASGPLGVLVLLAFYTLVVLAFGALGLFAALRTGSGEAVQGLFPVFFVFLFISSMAIPRNLMSVDLVPRRRDREPGLVPDRGRPQPGHRSAGTPRRSRSASAIAAAIAAVARRARRARAPSEAGAVRRLSVARGVAWRTLHNFFTNPALLIPSLVFPLFFFTAFAGGLSGIQNVPGFDFPSGYTAFQFAFVLSSRRRSAGCSPASGSRATSRAASPGGCCSRPPHRSGIVLGYAVAALVRWLDHRERAHGRRARRRA